MSFSLALSDFVQSITYSWYVSLTVKSDEEVETIAAITRISSSIPQGYTYLG